MSSLKITTTNLLPNKPIIEDLPYDQNCLLLTTAKPSSSSPSRESTFSGVPTAADRPAKRPTKLFDGEITPSNRFSEFYTQFPLKPATTSESHVLESAKLNLIQRDLNPFPSRKSMHISMIPSSSSSSCSSSSLSTLSSLSTISTPPLSPSETLSSQGKCVCCCCFWRMDIRLLFQCLDNRRYILNSISELLLQILTPTKTRNCWCSWYVITPWKISPKNSTTSLCVPRRIS